MRGEFFVYFKIEKFISTSQRWKSGNLQFLLDDNFLAKVEKWKFARKHVYINAFYEFTTLAFYVLFSSNKGFRQNKKAIPFMSVAGQGMTQNKTTK